MNRQSTNWIRFEGETYFVNPGERALDAMLRRGAPVAFSCRKGTCQSCLLQASSGDPGEAARARLPQKLRDLGFFLPCCSTDPVSVVAQRPDWSDFTYEAVVAGKDELAPGVIRLRLEPMTDIGWHAGQSVGLVGPGSIRRSYSITSIRDEDYFLEMHIRVYPAGKVSGWVAHELAEGDTVTIEAPTGTFHYDPAMADTPLTLIGTGTGTGAVLGLARDALRQGHRAPIRLFLGAQDAAGLYLADAAKALAAKCPNLAVTLAASRETAFGQSPARVAELAFAGDMAGHEVFLCGAPDAVFAARVKAVAHGVDYAQIHADPFDPPEPLAPEDSAKLAALEPDPEIWAVLATNDKLNDILMDFYTQVYDDPRLVPFFHRVTKIRAIEKQFTFLRDVFSGSHDYFGEKPFNAHHWMVISDELFDHRERLFFDTVRRHGLPEPLIRRWAAMQELFRREIVKAAPRGRLLFGVERDVEGYADEVLGEGTVCAGGIKAGKTAQMHRRTGALL